MDEQTALKIITEAKVLLSPIPDEDFIVNRFTDEVSKCCVIGHYQRLKSKNPNYYSNSNCTDKIESSFRGESPLRLAFNVFDIPIAEINNGVSCRFDENTPKARVMAAIDYILNLPA